MHRNSGQGCSSHSDTERLSDAGHTDTGRCWFGEAAGRGVGDCTGGGSEGRTGLIHSGEIYLPSLQPGRGVVDPSDVSGRAVSCTTVDQMVETFHGWLSLQSLIVEHYRSIRSRN